MTAITLGLGASVLRRRVGPTAWVVLEVMVAAGEPDGRGGLMTRTTAVRLAGELGIGRDAAVAALGALRRLGLIAFVGFLDPATGRFGAGSYQVRAEVLRALSPGLSANSEVGGHRPAKRVCWCRLSAVAPRMRQHRQRQLTATSKHIS